MDQAQRFEALLASGKDNAMLRFTLGKHYLEAGDAARASTHLRRAVEAAKEMTVFLKRLEKDAAA